MRRCFQLALGGLGHVAPNPLVGCVIVKDKKIIGEGFHRKFGKNHAEINAIDSANDKSLLKDAELYANLEPCNHQGKTPPCVERIIQCGISKVTISARDPNPKVSGRGIKALKDAGIEVIEGLLKEEELEMNRRYRTFHTRHRPYIVLKWAQTLDGFMDKHRKKGEKGGFQITADGTRIVVHQWRAEEQAILVGASTAHTDNPKLTVRDVAGRNPIRVLIDVAGRVNRKHHLFSDGNPTLVFGAGKDKGAVSHIEPQTNDILSQLMNELYKRQIQSVIIEGGRFTLDRFIQNALWDEARILIGDVHLGDGLEAPKIDGKTIGNAVIGKDRLITLRPR